MYPLTLKNPALIMVYQIIHLIFLREAFDEKVVIDEETDSLILNIFNSYLVV